MFEQQLELIKNDHDSPSGPMAPGLACRTKNKLISR